MSVFKELEAKGATDNWQVRSRLSDEIGKISTVDIEVAILDGLKNKEFLKNIMNLTTYRGVASLGAISQAIVDKFYSLVVKNDYNLVDDILRFDNVSSTLLETIADQTSEAHANNKSVWSVPGLLIGHANFTKALEDKLVASPKKYSFFYQDLAEKSLDEKNILKMAKYIKDGWAFRKVVKKRCLSHASLEKLAKIAPEAVVMHSRKLTPDFVDTMANSKKREIVASAVTNPAMRPETMRRILENADPSQDYQIIRNVAYNKKATLENLTLAFTKIDTGFYVVKEFLKRRDFMEHIQNKLKASK